MHGHYGFPPYLKGRRPCAPATCNFPADWAHHLAEVRGRGEQQHKAGAVKQSKGMRPWGATGAPDHAQLCPLFLPGLPGPQGLTGPVKDLRPTHLIVNSGLWASSNALPDWHAIAAAGAAAVAPQGGRAIWRGTTANRGRKVPVQP